MFVISTCLSSTVTLWGGVLAFSAAEPFPLHAPSARTAAVHAAVHAGVDRGDDQYNFIAGLYDRGLHSMVVKEAKTFLSEFKNHSRVPLVRYRLGQSQFELGRFEQSRKALAPLEELGSRFQYHKEAAFRMAQCSLELGDDEVAAQRFSKLAEDSEHYLFASSAYFAGEALFRRESYTAAARFYAKVLEARPDPQLAQGALYGLGWSLYRSQQYETAAKTFQLFLTRYPQDDAVAELRFLHGESLTRIGKHPQALQAYLAVPRGEYYDDALSAAGFAAAELDRHSDAAQLFLRLEQETPDSELLGEARLHAGIQCFRAGDMARARGALDRVLSSDATEWRAEACYWRGQVAAKLDGPQAALAFYDAGEQATDDAELLRRLRLGRADALFDAGKFDDAQAIYDAMEGGSADALYSSAVAALNAGNTEIAVSRARKLLQDSPDSPHALGAQIVVAEGLFAQKDHQGAATTFEELAEKTRTAPGQSPHPERPRILSRWAWSLFYQERYVDAAQTFALLSNEFPRDERTPEASFLEGRCWLRAGEFARAERILTQHLQAYSGTEYDDDARYDLAQSLLEQGKDAQAKQMLAAVAAGSESLGLRARYEEAELAARAQEDERVLQLLAPILSAEQVPDELLRASLYSHAWSSYRIERWPLARRSLQRLLADDTLAGDTAGPALELLTSVEQRAGDGEAALQAYEELRRREPDGARTPEVALVAAIALKENGRGADAAGLLTVAAKQWPDFAGHDRLLYELAFLHQALGDADGYVARLQQLEQTHPQSPLAADAAFYRGETLFEAGDFTAAREAYRRALADDSRVRDLARYKTAWCAFRLEELEEAAVHFQRLHQDHPDSSLAGESLFLAGESLYQHQDYAGAQRVLSRFVANYADHQARAKALFRLGLSQGEQRDFTQCLKSLSTLEKESPDFEHRLEAHLWIGRSHLDAGRLDEADRRFKKVLSEDRGLLAARAHIGRGKVLTAQKKWEDALGEFLKVALLFQNEAEVGEALWLAGHCLESTGDAPRAAQQYREILERFPNHPRAAAARIRLADLEANSNPEPAR